MRNPDDRSTPWAWAVAITVALILTYWLRYVLLPFAVAGALAYIARPLVHGLERRWRFPHWLAALLPFMLYVTAIVAGAYVAGRVLLPVISELANHLNGSIERLLQTVLHETGVRNPQKFNPHVLADRAASKIRDSVGEAGMTLAGLAIELSMGAVLTMVLLGFFLFSGRQLASGMLWLAPPYLRPRVLRLARQLDPMLGRYLRGVFLIVVFTSLATWVVAGPIFHIRHALSLAIAVGVLELVPVIGPVLSFLAFGIIAIEQVGIREMIAFGIFAIALRVSIDQLLAPLVLGRAARIPAAAVIFAFLAGGAIYGMLGVLLAIPAAATIKIVLADFYEQPPAR